MKPFSFYLVTDTHYLDSKLEPGGKAFEYNMVTEQYFVKESGAIISSTFDKIIQDKETDVVILPGDLVKNGEKESHNGFIKELYRLKNNNKSVYVITAGHDYNDSAYVLKGDGRVPVEGTDYNNLCEMYRDFGYGAAIAFDEPTHSYVAQSTDGVRMLAFLVFGYAFANVLKAIILKTSYDIEGEKKELMYRELAKMREERHKENETA